MILQTLLIKTLQVKSQVRLLLLADFINIETFLAHGIIVSIFANVAFTITTVLVLMIFEQTR